jgi:hypothetical protein
MPKRRKSKEPPKTSEYTVSGGQKVFVVNSHAEICIREIDDPEYRREHDGAKANTKTRQSAYNMRESPIAYMIAKGQVNQAQGEAGLHFRRIFEMAGGTGAAAMDYTKEPVDGGGFTDPLTERQWRAGKELSEAHAKLGTAGYELVRDVCGNGYFIKDLHATKWKQTLNGKLLRESLTTLAQFWGYETARIRKWSERMDKVLRAC